MAINVSFGGATIYKPGSYSETTVDIGGGFPIGPAGLVALIGEADAGRPGSAETSIQHNYYTADQMQDIRSKYRTGAIVDAAGFLFAPAADAAIPNGASAIWIYKTNASTQSSLTILGGVGGTGTYGTLSAIEYGIGGNRVTFGVTTTEESSAVLHGSTVTWPVTGAIDYYENGVKLLTGYTGMAGATGAVYAAQALSSDILGAGGAALVTNSGTALVITMPAASNAHRNGFGKSFEVIGGSAYGLTGGMNESTSESTSILTLSQKRDNITEASTVGGDIVLAIGYSGATTATVTINATSIVLTAGTATTLPLSAYTTLKDLADDINARSPWSASVMSSTFNNYSPMSLDEVGPLGANSHTGQPVLIKRDAFEFADFFATSLIGSWAGVLVKGLPDTKSATMLSGGALGASTTLDIVNALDQFTKFHINFIVPLFSRDAIGGDIPDGLTDSLSTYTIAGIHQAVKTHISLMKTVKRREERQGFMSIKASYDDCKIAAGEMADGREQLVIQDVRQANSQGNIKWFQPYALAALLCGARCGASYGEPMTFKYLNVSGVRQTAQAMTVADKNIVEDYDPNTQYDDAIQSGITFLESVTTGGFRVVVDNTTYGRDANFVWNRGNVIYAADLIAYNLRNGMEAVYVGHKNVVSVAEITGTASSILDQFKGQGLTVQTSDAPNGYKGLSVRLVGNTIYLSVIVKIVEGIDFVLSDITIQRATA